MTPTLINGAVVPQLDQEYADQEPTFSMWTREANKQLQEYFAKRTCVGCKYKGVRASDTAFIIHARCRYLNIDIRDEESFSCAKWEGKNGK